jgi:membrane fusion protein (multidrug efflux system)
MVVNLRSITVAAALLIALGGIGWFAVSDSNAPAGNAPAREGRGGGGQGRGAPVSVIVAPAKKETFAAEMEAIGSARANEAVDITAKTSNRVTAIHFREGQRVRQNEVLIELDSEQARANLAEAEAALSESRNQYKRSRELFSTKALSESQLDQLQATLSANEARVAAARAQLNDLIIRAPFAGRVGLRHVSLGGLVNPGTVITTLDDTTIIKLDFSVPEVFLSTVREGLEISARTSAYPESLFNGRVVSIDSRLDPVSRAIVVRAAINNDDNRLKPGMFMTVKLVRSATPALLIPEQAVVPEGERKFVYLVRDGKVSRAEVQTGRRRPGEVEVIQGVSEGDQVIVEGTQKVRDGAAVNARQAEQAS